MSGVRQIEGVNILPLDGLWDAVSQVPAEQRMRAGLAYAGVTFYDEAHDFVADSAINFATLGGVPLAHSLESDELIADRLTTFVAGGHETMAASANFSYLTPGVDSEKVYKKVTGLGHFSISHTVEVGIVVAGISAACEVELSLQRDLVHLSKVTNARTKVQDRPPLVVPDAESIPIIRPVYEAAVMASATLRSRYGDKDGRELANTIYPMSKATMMMVTGTLRNMGKLTDFKDDDGKEFEFRNLLRKMRGSLGTLWPEIFSSEGELTNDVEVGNAR